MNKTKVLLQIIGSPLLENKTKCELVESEELFNYAFRNNIEMLYLQALEEGGKLDILHAKRDEIVNRQQDTTKSIYRLSSVLQQGGILYAITKTLRPFPGTPNDIDCLYLGPMIKYEEAGTYLQDNHYRLTSPNDMQYEFFDELMGKEFSNEKSGGKFYIDFYRELAADHMPYMDSQVLAKEVTQVHVEGYPNPIHVFTPIAEMVVLSLHSVLMHRIVPLEVFYTYAYYMAKMDESDLDDLWEFTRINHAEPAMRAVLTLMKAIHIECYGALPDKLSYLLNISGQSRGEKKDFLQNDMHMPHVVRLSTFIISVFSKIRGKRARKGFLKELAHMLNPVFAIEVMHHMLSKKYIDKHSDHV